MIKFLCNNLNLILDTFWRQDLRYQGIENDQHGADSATGVLMTNLGIPNAPTKETLKPY